MQQYKNSLWEEFRESVLDSDNYKCVTCGRGASEVILQVHHKRYIHGRKPWEYETKECITLCKGCHAREHGIIQPKVGWEYIGDEDLEDLIGKCENCGSNIRYVFYVYHKDWGTIGVGTNCCDMLTDSVIASNQIESSKRYEGRKKRFIDSKRWKFLNGIYKIKHGNFNIEIHKYEADYYIKLETLQGKKTFKSLEIAKEHIFDVIENGEFIKYLQRHKINIDDIYIRK